MPVEVLGDATDEPDETFTLELSNAMNAVLMASTVTVTIQDDTGLLFRDGFETGNLSAWTGASPEQRFDDGRGGGNTTAW